MNLEQMRARLAVIVASLGELQKAENLTAEQLTEFGALETEYTDLSAQITAKEKMAAITAQATASQRQTTPAPVAGVPVVGKNLIENDPKRGFKNAGEFFMAVKNKDLKVLSAAGIQEKSGEDGGFLIPDDFRQEIQKKVQGDQSLLALTSQLQTSSNNITLPTYEGAPWDSTGVIQAYWEAEAAAFRESRPKFGQASVKLHKLTAMVRVTDEMLDDVPLMNSWISTNAPDAMLHKVNSAIISGSGVGMPQGFLNSSFKKAIAKEGSQNPDTVNYKNVQKMFNAFLPSSIPFGRWLINPQVIPQLQNMVFDTASAIPIPVYMPPGGASTAPYGTLFGIPIMPMMGGVKALGDEGDISLVDLRYLTTAAKTVGGGIKADISTHVYFATDESAFRFVMRLGGQCMFKTPITNEAGDYSASGFVTLADRA